MHMINAWERGARRPSERYWLLYLRVFPECANGEVQRRRSRGDGDRILRCANIREHCLELRNLRSHRQVARREHLRERGELLGSELGPGEPNYVSAGFRSRYQAIVRARPSSRSTFASHPSAVRALSTFGIRISTSV